MCRGQVSRVDMVYGHPFLEWESKYIFYPKPFENGLMTIPQYRCIVHLLTMAPVSIQTKNSGMEPSMICNILEILARWSKKPSWTIPCFSIKLTYISPLSSPPIYPPHHLPMIIVAAIAAFFSRKCTHPLNQIVMCLMCCSNIWTQTKRLRPEMTWND